MSIIHDALKKAEKEKNLSSKPVEPSPKNSPAPEKTSFNPKKQAQLVKIAILSLIAVVLILGYLLIQRSSTKIQTAQVIETPKIPTTPEPKKEAILPAESSQSSPENQISETEASAKEESTNTSALTESQNIEITRSQPELPPKKAPELSKMPTVVKKEHEDLESSKLPEKPPEIKETALEISEEGEEPKIEITSNSKGSAAVSQVSPEPKEETGEKEVAIDSSSLETFPTNPEGSESETSYKELYEKTILENEQKKSEKIELAPLPPESSKPELTPQKSTELKPPSEKKLSELLEKAIEYFKKDQLYEAEHSFQELLKDNPDLAVAHFYLGQIYERHNEIPKTLKSFEKTIKLDPNFSPAYLNLGIFYLKIGDSNSAIKNFEETIKLDKLNVEAYNNLGLAHKNLGNYPEAERQFLKALLVNPQYPEANLNLGNLLEKIGNREGALKYWQNFVIFATKEYTPLVLRVQEKIKKLEKELSQKP